MCRSRWIDRPAGGGDYFDYFRWGFDCFDFVYLECNSQPFGYVAESLCVVMSTIDQHMMIATAADVVVVVVAVGDVVAPHFYEAFIFQGSIITGESERNKHN